MQYCNQYPLPDLYRKAWLKTQAVCTEKKANISLDLVYANYVDCRSMLVAINVVQMSHTTPERESRWSFKMNTRGKHLCGCSCQLLGIGQKVDLILDPIFWACTLRETLTIWILVNCLRASSHFNMWHRHIVLMRNKLQHCIEINCLLKPVWQV